MSTTAGLWVATAAILLFLSFRRPVWSVAIYMLTFWAAPHLWWWGDEIPSARYALWTGLLLLFSVVWQRLQHNDEDDGHRFGTAHKLSLAMALNASVVHLVLAADATYSLDTYTELVKYVLLFFLLWGAIKDRRDFRIILMVIAIGSLYVGYEVTINERGDFNGSRLEGVGVPSADKANSLATVMLMCLPLIGGLFVYGRKEKLIAIMAGPLVLNVVLLCNSRGAFIGLALAALVFLVLARGPTRKKALQALALGCVALYLLLGDPQIFSRFLTTFSGSEERDGSAAGRLEYWAAGVAMIQDYPLGAGGGSFKYVLGRHYASVVSGRDEDRSLHNGYLTEATDWGLQGLFLKLAFIIAALAAAHRTVVRCRSEGRSEDALTGMCVIASMVALMSSCMFGSYLANEWNYWILAFLVRYSELYRVAEGALGKITVHAEPVRGVASPVSEVPAARAS